MNDSREPQSTNPRAPSSEREPRSHGSESRSRGPSSSRRFGAPWDDDEPFDFLLDLKELAQESTRRPADASALFPTEVQDAQSNVITKPPPPFLPNGAFVPPEEERPSRTSSPGDWEEVTPRSTSVAAAALLSSPRQTEPDPDSDDAPLAPVPSTDPTGGRRPAPASSAPMNNAFLSPRHGDTRLGTALDEGPATEEEKPTDPAAFAPSFTIDRAPITARGTRKLAPQSPRDAASGGWRRWGWMVLAAFLVPFAGGIAFTSWAESHRFKTTSNAATPQSAAPAVGRPEGFPQERKPEAIPASPEPSLHGSAVDDTALHGDALSGAATTPSAAPSDVASGGEREPARGENHRPATMGAPADKSSARKAKSKTRTAENATPVTHASDAQLTHVAKEDVPSYRVKIPDEQNSSVLRDGAHNVPVRE